MLRLFALQSRRLEVLRSYKALVTTSSHMRAEFLKHGFPPEIVHKCSYAFGALDPKLNHDVAARSTIRLPGEPWRLLFVGRMDPLKGGAVLLEALPKIAASLDSDLEVTFVGDGPARQVWEKRARQVQASHPHIRIQFQGWIDRPAIENIFSQSDLLVVPSLWPEPFGRIGPHAGRHSLPVAAFATGGISEWLIDGVNGHVAPSDPPTAQGLAAAVIKCLRDPALHEELRQGALRVARRFSLQNHIEQLKHLFESIAAVGSSEPRSNEDAYDNLRAGG